MGPASCMLGYLCYAIAYLGASDDSLLANDEREYANSSIHTAIIGRRALGAC
ncbi:uncharacterized protein PHACADRAFT_266211, partial [Phanerochaete carnosa HHB-10118-sp]